MTKREKYISTRNRLALSALFLLCFLGAKGQTNYSGVYYIGSAGQNATATDKYYLCPTEGWCFYAHTNDFTGTDNGMPFLTTYKCQDGVYDVRKAVWIIEKAPAPNDDYYFIKQALTGRYLTSNGTIRTTGNADRMRVHLESVASADLDDKELFTIDFSNDKYYISPKDVVGGANDRKWLVVNGGNKNALTGQSGKTGGPEGYENTAGIIGVYTKNDINAPFYLEAATPVTPAPTITNNFDGTITITGTGTIYYTTDGTEPTTSSSTYSSAITLTDAITVIKAMAKDGSNYESMVVTYELPKCETPVITVSNGTVTITTTTAGASIYYTDDNTTPTSTSTLYNSPFPLDNISVIRAIAVKTGWAKSDEAYYMYFATVSSSNEITNMHGFYRLASGFNSIDAIGSSSEPFGGVIDGQMYTISGLNHPLVAYANSATIKNVILDNVVISSGTNVGAICGEATGASRIYNCGVLATGSTVNTDESGYTFLTDCSSTISGSGSVGGLVGLLDGESRVINCFSYANIEGGNLVGGIVGENTVATTATNLKTMVMNCMFYGEVSGDSIAPIYNGNIITNVGQNTGVSNFNYFRLESAYIQDNAKAKAYNCALGAEDRFLQRFEFYRHLLNSHRELAGWWATGTYSSSEMMKWVLEPSQIGTSTPYPILKSPGRYPSVVNIDAENATTGKPRNQGGKLGTLAVTIQMGSGAVFGPPTGAAITINSLNLNITDKDTTHFNYNYYKVQLPYYNEVGSHNYRKHSDSTSRVVTGWKIVEINGSTTGTGRYEAGDDVSYDAGGNLITPYNFADRNCTNKDLYSVSGRVFSQGAYWDVPYGVSAITIEPYWAKCVYLADAYADVVYNQDMSTAYNVPNVGGGQQYTNRDSYPIAGENQRVFTNRGDAISSSNNGLFQSASGSGDHTVYDYAVVLVGNYHHYGNPEASMSKPYTFTSVDLDGDNEPDYSYIMRFDSRQKVHPVRVDFINIPGLGMAQKSTGGTGSYNFGIMQPKGWFESTNTSLFRVTQFEYDCDKDGQTRVAAPYILQGGVMEQWVLGQNQGYANNTTYFHVGGNVWFKEFHRGTHQDQQYPAKHPPVSVTGGDFDQFHLTGLYRSDADIFDDDAECYITGGRFGVVAGTGMDGIGDPTNHTNGNITWIIDNADIKEFYAGSFNADKPAQGNLLTIVNGGHIDLFCGGPKFGDMNLERTVITTATGCTFGTFFGAGYGGNSYGRQAPFNHNNIINFPHNSSQAGNDASWNAWLNRFYRQSYNATYGGVSTQFSYQFIPMSGNTDNCARIFVEYVKFSLATTHSVTSTLTDCTILNNFYGGGNLGKVDGEVSSVLESCTVKGNVYGAGYSASLPTVEVDSIGGFRVEPYYYKDLGTYRIGVKGKTTTYTWEQCDEVNSTQTAIYTNTNTNTYILYTQEDLGTLGTVDGNVTLTLKGNTIVGDGTEGTGNVFGGGAESVVNGNTTVKLQGKAHVLGNVYGGGNEGEVGGNSSVIFEPEPYIAPSSTTDDTSDPQD